MLLFVYGSLKKGFHNHALLAEAEFVGNAVTTEKYYMCGRLNTEIDEFEDGRQFSYPPRTLLFPYIYKTTQQHMYDTQEFQIHGELYNVSKECLDVLDVHEGHPTIYKRTIISINFDGSIIEADVYLLNNDEILHNILTNKNLFIPIKNGMWCSDLNYNQLLLGRNKK